MEFAAHLPLLSHGKRQSESACADGCHGWRWFSALGMLFSVPVCAVFFIFHTKTRPEAVVAASGREERNEAEHQLPA